MRHGPSRPSLETDGRTGTETWPSRWLAPAVGIGLVLLVVVPAFHLPWAALTRAGWVRIDLISALLNSGAASAAATLVAAAVALPLAWVLSATDLPGARALRAATLATLLMPSFGFALGWHAIMPQSLPAVTLTLALAASAVAPIMIAVTWALASSDATLDDAAQLLGTPALQRYAGQLQRMAPGLAAALVLTFAKSFTDLGAPLLLATPNGAPFLTTEILRALESASQGATAAAAALLLCALIVLSLRLADQLSRRSERVAVDGADGASATTLHLGRWRWPIFALCCAIIATLTGLPAAGLLVAALPRLDPNVLLQPLLATATVATLAAALALAIAASLAILGQRSSSVATAFVQTLGSVPAAIPGLAIAIGMLGAYGSAFGGPLPLLVLSTTALALPGAQHHIRRALAAIPLEEDYAARMLGADRRATFVAIFLPQLSPALIGAWALVFAGACRELPAALILSSPHARTLAAESMARARDGHFDQAAALAIALFAVSAVVVCVATRISGTPLLMPRR